MRYVTWLYLFSVIALSIGGSGCNLRGTRPGFDELSTALLSAGEFVSSREVRQAVLKNSGEIKASKVVEFLFSKRGELWYEKLRKRCPKGIAVLPYPDVPWSVVISAPGDDDVLRIEAYGRSLKAPWRVREVSLRGGKR